MKGTLTSEGMTYRTGKDFYKMLGVNKCVGKTKSAVAVRGQTG